MIEKYVLIIVFVLAGICLHLNTRMKYKNGVDIVIRLVLVFMMIHVTIEFIDRALPHQYRYVNWAAPFGLMYGPLLYMGYLSADRMLPNKGKIIIHSVPFLLVTVCHIVYFLLSSKFRESIQFVYGAILYTGMALSWISYSVWVIYIGSEKEDENAIEFKNLISVILIILLTLATFLMIMVYTRTVKGITTRTISSGLLIYLGMLSAVVFIYRYTLSRFMEVTYGNNIPKPILPKKEVLFPHSGYQKSSLREELMIEYIDRVNAFIEFKCYLDPNLNLGKMAAELKIPKHHLSQLFSQHYKQGFLEYMNTFRVRHACEILRNPLFSGNIEECAEQCGFNSKTSFYRNFKDVTEMTPTEFLTQSSSIK